MLYLVDVLVVCYFRNNFRFFVKMPERNTKLLISGWFDSWFINIKMTYHPKAIDLKFTTIGTAEMEIIIVICPYG